MNVLPPLAREIGISLAIFRPTPDHPQRRSSLPLLAPVIQLCMLEQKDSLATVAVKDLNIAKRFYEGTLGLKPLAHQGEEAITYQSGHARLIVYRSQYAGTNRATAVNWIVGRDIEAIVRDLQQKGVRFEHYDLPGLKRDGDIHSAGDFKTVWFKDPDGNILSLVTG